MNKVVEFYDPHPGLMGCPTPLPEKVCLVAATLSGMRGTVEQAIHKIWNACPDEWEGKQKVEDTDVEGSTFIFLSFRYPDGRENGWRVIRYRKVNDEGS